MPGGKKLTPEERRRAVTARLKAGTATAAEKYKAGVKTPEEFRKSERKRVELHAFNRSERIRKDKESKALMAKALARQKEQQKKKPSLWSRMFGGVTKKRSELLDALGRKK
jgi:hypothetical protein